MFDIALFLDTYSYNLEDLNISDEILQAMLEVPQMDIEPIDLHVFDIESHIY